MIIKYIDSIGWHITVEGVFNILYDSIDDCVIFKPLLADGSLIIRYDEDPDNNFKCATAKVYMNKIKGGLTVI